VAPDVWQNVKQAESKRNEMDNMDTAKCKMQRNFVSFVLSELRARKFDNSLRHVTQLK
jgi:hypothetical protein